MTEDEVQALGITLIRKLRAALMLAKEVHGLLAYEKSLTESTVPPRVVARVRSALDRFKLITKDAVGDFWDNLE